MNRSLKILFAFGCCVMGFVLSLDPQLILATDSEWLYQILSAAGFILMMVSGLYGVLKLARPFVCHLNQVSELPEKR